MGDADVDVVLRTIKDPMALYLGQHLMARGIKVVDPPQRVTIRSRVHEAATRMGQVGQGDGIHNRYFQPRSTGT